MLEKDDIISITINKNGDIIRLSHLRRQTSPYVIDVVSDIDKANIQYIFAYNKLKLEYPNTEVREESSADIGLNFIVE